MCRLILLSLVLLTNSAMASSSSLWENVNSTTDSQAQRNSITLRLLPDSYRLLKLDEQEMHRQLSGVSVDVSDNQKSLRSRKSLTSQKLDINKKSNTKPTKSLEVPLPNGESIIIKVIESSVMADELANKHPSIRTYQVASEDNNGIYGAIDMTTQGFHAMLFMPDGRRLFIDPRQVIEPVKINKDQDKGNNVQHKSSKSPYYISYYNKDYHPDQKKPFQCNVEGHHHNLMTNPLGYVNNNVLQKDTKITSAKIGDSSINLITYRLAMATTAEYTAFHGGTTATASAIATTVNRVNVIYKRDLAVQFELVANNDLLIQSSTTTYSNYDGSTMLTENQALVDNVIGTENYDIGHVVSTGGGGVAFLGTVCNDNYKAQGVTGNSRPIGDAFDIDYVAHEIGHQLAAQHTFNKCANYSRSTFLAYEPGSGSTIMGYAGICDLNNIQQHSDAMLHAKSIAEMRAFITRSSSGGSCGTRAALNNQPPTVNAGMDYTIPPNTPFELIGNAADPENDLLSYSWEQIDKGDVSDINTDTSNNPLFRVFPPRTTSTRIFPNLSSILSNTTSMGETLPTTTRNLNFLMAVRDGKGNVSSDQLTLSVEAASMESTFEITSHTSFQTLATGEVTEITWNIANTDTAPVNCSAVNIFLSTDHGVNFVNISGSVTPNDGSELITIPVNTPLTTEARFKIKCDGNIFFNISTANLRIEAASNYDSDGDGTPDISDAFPLDFDEDADTDGDGVGNNADSDDDGDGVLDSADDFPLDPSKSSNSNFEAFIGNEGSISGNGSNNGDPNTGNTGEPNPAPNTDVAKILPIIINLLLSD